MKKILMPKLGLTMERGLITKWLIKTGDEFKEDDVILEVETDKVTSEVKAQFSGKLINIIVDEDEEAKVGQSIAEAKEH